MKRLRKFFEDFSACWKTSEVFWRLHNKRKRFFETSEVSGAEWNFRSLRCRLKLPKSRVLAKRLRKFFEDFTTKGSASMKLPKS